MGCQMTRTIYRPHWRRCLARLEPVVTAVDAVPVHLVWLLVAQPNYPRRWETWWWRTQQMLREELA